MLSGALVVTTLVGSCISRIFSLTFILTADLDCGVHIWIDSVARSLGLLEHD